MQNMLDIHLNSMSIPEQALGTSSNVQYLYTVPGDQTTYCLSGLVEMIVGWIGWGKIDHWYRLVSDDGMSVLLCD
jgi:hypothetical protein